MTNYRPTRPSQLFKEDLEQLPVHEAARVIPEGEYPEDLMTDPELPTSTRVSLAQEWLTAVECQQFAQRALEQMQADIARFKKTEESVRRRLATLLMTEKKKRDFILVGNKLVGVQIRAKGIPYVFVATEDVTG